MKPPYPISGKIATRKCPTCGHHEVGYITADGSFYPLKTGETIEVLPEDSKLDFPKTAARTQPERPDQGPRDSEEIVAWIPDPVKQNRALRIKYGVFIRRQMVQSGVTESIYELAYRQKLQDLIEKEVGAPIPVILDRYFNSPHLAAGNSKDIADALFDELDEVREPVNLMAAWLAKTDDGSLKKLIHPQRLEELDLGPFREDVFRQELENLGLEEFFELL